MNRLADKASTILPCYSRAPHLKLVTASERRPAIPPRYALWSPRIRILPGKVIFVIPLPKDAPKTILLVEDNDGIRMLVQHILENGGFEVLVASDAAGALQIESNFPRIIHLLLSDVMMPGISGPELAKKLKAQRPEMRVMLMSGYSEGMLILNYGWYFIQKPFVPTALMGRVNDLLQSDVSELGTDHFDTRL